MLKYGLIISKIIIPSLVCAIISAKLYATEVLLVDVEWASAIRLIEYKGYKSASLSKYNVPDGTTEVLWDITASALPDCPHRDVFIYLRHGSYPLATPYNETYPENFMIEKSHFIKLTTDNISLPYSMKYPKAGPWFLAGFLPKAQHRYTQAGLNNNKCAYGMGVRVISKSLASIDEISAGKTYTFSIHSNKSKTLRLTVPEGTISYTVLVTDCSRTGSNSTSCPLLLVTASHHLPSVPSSPYVNCTSDRCLLEYNSPVIKEWNYITFKTHAFPNVSEIQFNLEVNTQNCLMNQYVFTELVDPVEDDVNQTKIIQYRTKPAPPVINSTCVLLQQMGRFDVVNEDFVSIFIFPDPYFYPWPNMRLFCPDHQVLLTYFDLLTERDAGGTLKIIFSTSKLYLDPTQNASVVLCLMKYSIPSLSTINECSDGMRLNINTTSLSASASSLYIPYPTGGRWYIGMTSKCYNQNGHLQHCRKPPIVSVQVYVTRCVDNKCGQKGNCEEFISGMLLFSSCDCLSDWRGYGCTDGSEAESDGVLLSTMLLLTLSNAFFIPGIFLSIKRKMFVEGLVYVFTMFFSTFYHACDVNNVKYTFCMMDYDVLSFCDFYGSILSFWVTLLAMSRLNDTVRSVFHMLGALCLALGVEYNKHGLWVFVIPAIAGVIIMSISWVVQCRRRKGCYPSKWRYVKFILPGILLAATGLIIFAFLETDENYKYTHSAWHVVIALSIVFLLPSRKNMQAGYSLVRPDGVEEVSMMPADGRNEDSDDECILQPNSSRSRTDWNIIL